MSYDGPFPHPVKTGGTGRATLTNHSVLIGAGTTAITQVGPVASTGCILASNGVGSDPGFTTATYPLTTAQGDLLLSSAANTITTLAKDTNATRYLSNTGTTNNAAWAQIALATGVSGQLPLANGGTNANLTASNGGIFYSTATAGAILSGTATANQVLLSGSSTTPAWSTATYPATTTVSQILYSSSANVITGLATANRAVLTTGTTGIPVLTALAVDGQIIIGSTAGSPAATTLTAGVGISITNGSNTISIATTTAAGGGLVWTDVTGATQTIVAGNAYLANRGGGVAFSLPASGTVGDVFRIAGVQGSWTLAQAANQQIKFGSTATTLGAAGSLASANAGDCVECVATNTSASTIWRVISSIGNITVA